MPHPPEISALLSSLDYVQGGTAGVHTDLDRLFEIGRQAVPSLVAVAVTGGASEAPVTTLAGAGVSPPIVTSLRLMLPGHEGASLILYAAEPGALAQLAADLPALLDIHRKEVELDLDLVLPPRAVADRNLETQLEDATIVNRALGVLLDRGDSLAECRRQLAASAVADDISIVAEARKLLARLHPPGQGIING